MVRSDPVVRAALMMVMLPIAEAEWTVEPAGSEPEDLEVAEFVRRAMLEHLDWRKVVWHALPVRYGHAVLEESYEAVDWALSVPDEEGDQAELPERTYWAPAAYQPRLGRTIWRWNVDTHGRLQSITQQRIDPATGNHTEVEIEVSRLLVITNEQEGDDYTGVSILRSAYRSWYTKEKLELVDAMAKERTGLGLPVGTVPSADWDSESQEMEDVLRGIRAGEESFAVLRGPDAAGEGGQTIAMLDMRASSQADCMPSLNYHVTQILWSVLAPWMNLGQGGEGARATAETQDDPFYLGLNYVAGQVASAFNRQAVPRLVAFNFTTTRYPRLVCGEVRPLDLAGLVGSIAALLTAGGIETDAGLEAALRSMLGLPEKLVTEDEEPEVEEEETPPPPLGDPEPPAPPADPAVEDPETGDPETGDPETGDPEDDPAKRALSEAPTTRWRALTPVEEHVALDQIDATVEEQRQRYEALARDHAVKVAEDLSGQVASLPADGDLERPDALEGALADQIAEVLTAAAAFGRVTVRQELAGQRRTLAAGDAPASPEGLTRWISKRARLSAKAVVNRLMSRAETLGSGFGPDGPSRERTMAALTSTAESGLRSEAVATVSQALAAGRRAETEAAAAEGLASTAQYSAILDANSCGPCAALDGEIYQVGSEEYERDYPPLADCAGGSACRCLFVLIADDEVPSER